jgi:glycosyltransferase involved in cell wall biosynthesis
MLYFIKNTILTFRKILYIFKRDVIKHPIFNYFNENHPKRVLISYITRPFRTGVELTHTNSAEVLEIAQVFRALGFNVDIADYDYEGYIDYKKYNAILGFGDPLVNSFKFNSIQSTTRIYYGTGMHISIQNQNSTKRIEAVKNKKGIWIPESGRIVEKAWTQQTTNVNAMIVLGNEEVKKSYQKYFEKNIYLLSPSIYKQLDYKKVLEDKNFEEAKNNYLWFGSSGLIHKGLDLVLDVFKTLPDLHLHVCGPIENEPKFKKAYYDELYNTVNIHTYGFIKIDTSLFKKILYKCAFIIFPSCSEGGAPSVLNVCVNGGLIPIVTKEASIDTDGFGLLINSFELSSVKKAIEDSQKLSKNELKILSELTGKKISEFSLENYSKLLKTHLSTILNTNNSE